MYFALRQIFKKGIHAILVFLCYLLLCTNKNYTSWLKVVMFYYFSQACGLNGAELGGLHDEFSWCTSLPKAIWALGRAEGSNREIPGDLLLAIGWPLCLSPWSHHLRV